LTPTRTSESLPASPPATSSIRPASQLRDPARYQILGEHGRGGLGRVSRAHDLDLGRDVAIKELISRGNTNELRFLREALITARLEHPGIVPVHEAGRWPDGTPFYAMKLVSGRPLRDLIAERTTVSERIGLLHHVIAVADAIAYAHRRNIIHRDLKPANVIVGEFGETVVIDWGLAKDLSAGDDPAIGGPFRSPAADDLTATGSVLGTPAYMAPEQKRGEPVDQRADVFAIGAMLWELCALHRVPVSTQGRHRTLQRAGIDRDLATIIEKAVDADPVRRYADAGELAADLKAFKSGARIAARSYSLLAMLGHWTRRHQAIAAALATVLALAVAGSVLYVRNIAAERDRADGALGRAQAANAELTLEHAALLLRGDPTTAVAELAHYEGDDLVRRDRLLAEARGRGVARAVLKPHNNTIWFLAGEQDGGIVSVGADWRIRVTRDGTSTTVATDVSPDVRASYSPARRRLAYATAPPGVGLLDLATRATTRLDTGKPTSLSLAPDGSRLAAVDEHHRLTVWALDPAATILYRETIAGAYSAVFMTPAHLVVIGDAVQLVSLDPLFTSSNIVPLPGMHTADVRPDRIVVGLVKGTIVLLSPSPDMTQLVASEPTPLCDNQVLSVKFVGSTDLLAFTCLGGTAGIARYDLPTGTLVKIDSFTLRGRAMAVSDAAGRQVAFSDQSTTLYVYDVRTRLMTHNDGQAAVISFVASPTPEHGQFIAGDVNGTIRVWDRPTQAARALARLPLPLYTVAFLDNDTIVTAGADQAIHQIDVVTGVDTPLGYHDGYIFGIQVAPDRQSFVSFGWDGNVRVWRPHRRGAIRVFSGHGSIIEDASYTADGNRVVSIGDDGRLFAWSPDREESRLLLARSVPLVALEVMAQTGHVAVQDTTGSMWDVSPAGATTKIRDGDGTAWRLASSSDGRLLAAGSESGAVILYRTADWTVAKETAVPGRVSLLQFDPQGRDLLIGSEDRPAVRLLALDHRRDVPWRDIAVSPRDLAYSADGETIAITCTDGQEWFYSIPDDSWVYTHDHESEPLSGQFSPDGKRFASVDAHGVVVVRDMAQTFIATQNLK
jgi:eukaryotic-like serine/threonine-protein kinase